MADRFGTSGDDQYEASIVGTDENDRYFGFAGFDFLAPTLGDDILDGGDDSDVAIYGWFDIFTNGITINNTASEQNGVAAFTTDKRGFGTDTLIGMENFHGTNYDDEIYLGYNPDGTYTFDEWGDDLVVAFQGDTDVGNHFVAGPGDDTYVGSMGEGDLIDFEDIYTGSETGVTVLFTGIGSGFATDPWGGTDTFFGIEEIQGTQQDDTITTGDGDNGIMGFAGDDTLIAGGGRDDLFGGAGDDTLDGGAGDRDEARYDDDIEQGGGSGVTVDLAAGIATDGFGDTDTLIGIEDVRGTDSADTISGDDGDNTLDGRGGNDFLYGREGRDFLIGGAGDDILDGGDGDEDRVSYDDDIEHGGGSGVTVDLAAGTATDGFGDTDTLIGIENVRGQTVLTRFPATMGTTPSMAGAAMTFFMAARVGIS
ncbi:calcium-binding protein [Poseidonocella sedimentorum]|uniref:Hemolysin-type calcium-binding repeat-containing protein n=1 Tax=Poseidonocella sedimentorum TaxID=871652 RepID=A0A1I6DLN3_9RHOB|nr:calcium-binding protein [Poseidonocella sedimentorum]SFR06291.1 hypothetical protein SAMN04515673_10469 [Poseidonocella sedimentorum]